MFEKEFAAAAGIKAVFLKRNPVGYFLASMLTGVFIGFGALLAFTIGGLLDGAPYTKVLMGGVRRRAQSGGDGGRRAFYRKQPRYGGRRPVRDRPMERRGKAVDHLLARQSDGGGFAGAAFLGHGSHGRRCGDVKMFRRYFWQVGGAFIFAKVKIKL